MVIDRPMSRKHMVNGIPFVRSYGLSSEPQIFAMYLLYSMIMLKAFKVRIGINLYILLLLCFALTFSVLTFTCLLFVIAFTNCLFDKKRHRFYIILLLLTTLIISYFILVNIKDLSNIANALYSRTFKRVIEVFMGEDISGMLRTRASWEPLFGFLKNLSSMPFGVSMSAAVDYIEGYEIVLVIDNSPYVVSGQPSVSLFYYIISFGIFVIFTLIATYLKLNSIDKVIVLIALTYINPYGLSAGFFIIFSSLYWSNSIEKNYHNNC